MSIVSYNGVTLPYARIVNYEQNVVRDPDGDTDWYLNRFDITVQQVVNTDYTRIYYPTRTDAAFAQNPALLTQIMYNDLMQPRKRLSITFDGKELIPSTVEGVPGTVDAQNGPKPQSCRFLELTNKTFICLWHVIAHYWVNPELIDGADDDERSVQNNPANPVLYNRWSETADIADNFVTRTRSGKFVIRSDNKEGFVADELRTQFAVVGVPKGFLRTSSKYTLDPSGLGIAYTVIDQEQFNMPPSPAFRAEGWYRETTTINGAKRYCEAFVRLEADKNTSQVRLLCTAIDVVVTKCKTEIESFTGRLSTLSTGNGISDGVILENAVVETDLYKNEVSVLVRFLVAQGSARIITTGAGKINLANPLAAFKRISCISPRSDPEYTPKYLDYGTAGLFLRAAKYYDPNLAKTELEPIDQELPGATAVTTVGVNARRQTAGNTFEPGTAGKED